MSTETTTRNEKINQLESEIRDLLFTVRRKMQEMQSEIDSGFMFDELALAQEMGLIGHDDGASDVEQVRDAGRKLMHVATNKERARQNVNRANDAYGQMRTALGELGVIRFES